MNVAKIIKIAVKAALVLADTIAGSSVTFVASQKKISKHKKKQGVPSTLVKKR